MAAVPSIGRASLVERPYAAPQAEATQGLYERHAAKIQAYCHHQLGSREEAEDAVQTTFMNAFRALGRGVVPEAESAWLFKIAENVCLSRRRSSWRRGRIESPSDFDVIEEVIPGPNRQRDELIGIEDALASMPEQQRRAILLREWQGLSYREVADELEISQSAVETLIFRARRSLAQGLEQPETIKRPKRKSLRRALRALDFGSIVAAAKTLLAGSAAVKATAAAVAVTAAAGTAATVVPKHEGHSPKSTPKTVVAAKPAPAPAPADNPASFRFVPAADSVAGPAAAKQPAAPTPVVKAGSQKPQPQASAPVAAAPALAPASAPAAAPAATEPAPAPVAAAPQPEHHAAPAPVAPAEAKSDEGQSDPTARHPAAVAPVAIPQVPLPAPTAPAPAPAPAPASGAGGTSSVKLSPVQEQIISLLPPSTLPISPTTAQPTSTQPTVSVATTVQPVAPSVSSPTVTTASISALLLQSLGTSPS